MKMMSFMRAAVLIAVSGLVCSGFGQVFVPDSELRHRPIHPLPPHSGPMPISWAAIEIQSTKVSTKIHDQVAHTQVEQILYNPNPQQMEGSLLFPVPRGAQLDKFTMEIDGKMV